MTDPWSPAVAEAYASADVKVHQLDTLEIWHPALVDEEGNPDPIRLVRDVRAWDLKLEAGAPRGAGLVVPFRKLLFDIDLPSSGEGPPSVTLALDAVDRSVVAAAERIVTIRAAVDVIYRCYTMPAEGDPAPEPAWVLAGLKLRSAKITTQRMTGTLTFNQLSNRQFPARVYTRQEYPGLRR